jgi:hypothetical protein
MTVPSPSTIQRIELLLFGDIATERAARAYLLHNFHTSDVRELSPEAVSEILSNPYEFTRRALAFHEPQLL